MDTLQIGDQTIAPGTRVDIELPVALLHTQTPLTMPVRILRGKHDGPRLFVSAAIHGDELNGVEIIRRLHQHKSLSRLRGTLITIPTVNVFGVIHHSRYLPDRRDLNRSFPGSSKGSLASRLAFLFMNEIVANCTHGIDLHTGAVHRANLPQLRVNINDPETNRLAHAFGVPVILNSDLRDGSLRQAASEQGVPLLLYEGGEALRFDEFSIRAGVKGVLNVMRTLGMLPQSRRRSQREASSVVARSSVWVRAVESGILRSFTELGARVARDEVLGAISSPCSEEQEEVRAPVSGIIIGKTRLPLVNEGDALFHLARFEAISEAANKVDAFAEVMNEPVLGDPSDGEQPIV